MSTEAAIEPEDRINGRYTGEGAELFWLAFKTGMLTVITLGIYRFWAKTRIRRYMWSATSPGGNPFEYTGTGLEKFLGFLIAIVVLAIYLGVLQLILFAIGLSVFSGGTSEEDIIAQVAAAYLTLFALLPLIFYASYRMRRYILSRTRWRGVRFGADKAAWGFMWRALGYTLLVIVSLGILSPLMTFKLEKFLTDRTWYGDTKFQQGGKWTMLYKPMMHLFIGVGILLASIPFFVMGGATGGALGGLFGFVGAVWYIVGVVHYNVEGFNVMARYKLLGENIRFNAQVSTSTVIGRYLVGYLAVSLILTVAMIPIFIIFAIFAASVGAGLGSPEELFVGPAAGVMGVLFALAYVAILVIAGALTLVFMTQPIVRHYVEEITIFNASELDQIRQRSGHDQVDAEGFADALDVGAAF